MWPRPVTHGPTTRCAACSRPPMAARPGTRCSIKSPRTGAIDLVMDPSDPNTLYAAMWQRVRRKWSDPRVEPGYKEGGIWKTTDGGPTWAEASEGLPAPQFRGRIGIDISALEPERALCLRGQLRRGTSAARRRARRLRPADRGEPHQGGRDLPDRRQGQDVAKGQREQRLHDQPLGHVWVGLWSDSRRSGESGHDLHAWVSGCTCRATPARRSRRSAACTAIIMASGSIRRTRRSSTTPTTAASTGPRTPGRRGGSRSRLVARSSTTSRSTPARRRGPTDRSRTTAAGADG